MRNKGSDWRIHVLACIAFLAIPMALTPHPPDVPFMSRPAVRDFFGNCLMLGVFYLNYFILIPRLYFEKKHLAYASVIVISFALIIILPSLLTGEIPLHRPGPPPFGMRPHHLNHRFRDEPLLLGPVRNTLFLYIAVVLFSIVLRIRLKLFETEVHKHDAEVGTLKNQINPHFLFNTLNNIYAFAIREKSSLTATAILRLSSMMRYVVTETSKEFVPLQKEINYTNDYIDLQRMRLTDTLKLSYVVDGAIEDQRIAPVILMPFIENTFKHGVNPDQESFINIRIEIADQTLTLITENKKVQVNQELHTRSGVGLENTRARLELLYHGNYSLDIRDESDYYCVTLKIELI